MSQTIARPSVASLPHDLAVEFASAKLNGCVGTQLLSEDRRSRVWMLVLAPGERLGFHTHVLDYFWNVLTTGLARSHYGDGRVQDREYRAGDIQHMSFEAGHSLGFDLANIGDTELIFTTVEFLDSANSPLDLPEAVRVQAKYAKMVRA